MIPCLLWRRALVNNNGMTSLLRLQEVERELQLQISLKQEMEMAARLLEKDIHEKQDSMVSLRHQLDEVKNINIDMYNKTQVLIKSIMFKFVCFYISCVWYKSRVNKTYFLVIY